MAAVAEALKDVGRVWLSLRAEAKRPKKLQP